MERTDQDRAKFRRAGTVAQDIGAEFERIFERNCRRHGVTITRFPDGCRQVGAHKLIRVETPFDWILSYQGYSAFLDTKTCHGSTFPHSIIKPHQVSEMALHEIAGQGRIQGGYVIWLRRADQIVHVTGLELEKLRRLRGSIEVGQSHVTSLGTAVTWDVRKLFVTTSHPKAPGWV